MIGYVDLRWRLLLRLLADRNDSTLKLYKLLNKITLVLTLLAAALDGFFRTVEQQRTAVRAAFGFDFSLGDIRLAPERGLAVGVTVAGVEHAAARALGHDLAFVADRAGAELFVGLLLDLLAGRVV